MRGGEVLAGAAEVVTEVGGHGRPTLGRLRRRSTLCHRRSRMPCRRDEFDANTCARTCRASQPRLASRRMLARVTTFAIDGIEPRRVTVEVDIRPGLPAFAIVGLGDTRRARGARARARRDLSTRASSSRSAASRSTSRPRTCARSGRASTCAIAVGVLAASGQVPAEALERLAVFGELSLGGELRPCRGALAVAEGARRAGPRAARRPARARAREAALVDGLEVVGAERPRRGRRGPRAASAAPPTAGAPARRAPRAADASPTWPTCAATRRRSGARDRRGRRPQPAAGRAARAPARRCSPAGCRRSCRR